MSDTKMTARDAPGEVEMACLGCGAMRVVAVESAEARGIFNCFCPGGECEDRYAARL